MTKVLIIADDLTGAADTGVQFSQRGWQTVLALEPGAAPQAEVLVLSSETRGLESAQAAAEGVGAWLHELALAEFDWIYKKIDSTLRGHPAAELGQVLEQAEAQTAAVLIAPAFPAQGRTTLNGVVYVHGVPLEQTSFALNGDLRRIFGASTPLLTLDTIRAGGAALLALLRDQRGPVLADAETDLDLQSVAQAARQAGVRVFCGSAGLAAALVAGSGRAPVKKVPETKGAGGVLAVVGSLHPIIAAQVEFARLRGAEVITVASPECAERVSQSLARGGLTILATEGAAIPASSGSDLVGEQRIPPAPLEKRGVRRSRLLPPFFQGGQGGFFMSHTLAQIAAAALAHSPLRGLILSGGDTARAVCQALGCTQLRLGGEIEAGIPWAVMQDGCYPGLVVATKAGGFGTEASLWRAYEVLQK